MGSGGSKKQKPPTATPKQQPAKNVQAAQPMLPPQPPYFGPLCEYRFENFQIPYEVKTGVVFMPNLDMQISTLDASVYIPTIASLYDLGYRLMSFAVFPGSMTTSGFLTVSAKTLMKCQAICRKARPDESIRYRMRVEKSILPMQMFTYGMFRIGSDGKGNADHIFKTIFDVTSAGARLVSIEITGGNAQNARPVGAPGPVTGTMNMGMGRGMGMGMGMGMGAGMGMGTAMNISVFGFSAGMILGVDIFFEEPVSPGAQRYVYQCVPLNLHATCNPMTLGVMQGMKWHLQMDWQGLVAQYCGTGWRLVEIFLDQSSNTSVNSPIFTTKVDVNLGAMFIFEKEESKINDNTPIYEITMVEYRAPGKITAGIGTTSTNINVEWDAVVASMGNAGWELVRIMNTPGLEMRKTTLNNMMAPEFDVIMWMFFQREIVREPQVKAPVPQSEEPPAPVLAPK